MNLQDLGPSPTQAPPVTAFERGMALFDATPPNYESAVRCFTAAADAGSGDGLAMLGLCQLEGLGMPADPVQARAVLKQAAGRRSALGRFQLGRVLMTGRGGEADEAAGLTAYVAAAAMGHAEATFNLANCLFAGVGCIPDRLAAKSLYLRARALGCPLRPRGVLVKRSELKAVAALAQRFADPNRMFFLVQERQQELALAAALPRPVQDAEGEASPRTLRHAGRLAAGVVAAVAGTLGQFLRPSSRDAGPTKLDF
ncbi:tetratricopeptide repeat protein [Roseateles sp. NT4]|uniref:tetratricopeptide repeat protein n=1 Tax=Roseateles sp. NT4 TaxID=3453715 RepID=UPI003EED3FEC